MLQKLHFQLGITNNNNLQSTAADDLTIKEAFILNTEATKQMNDFFLAQCFKASLSKKEGDFPPARSVSSLRTHSSEAFQLTLLAFVAMR